MGPIDEDTQSFSLDCYFRQSWRDDRLGYDAAGVSALALNWQFLEKIWCVVRVSPQSVAHNPSIEKDAVSCHDLTSRSGCQRSFIFRFWEMPTLVYLISSYPRPLNFVQMTCHTCHRRLEREKMLLSFFLSLSIHFSTGLTLAAFTTFSGCPTHSSSTGRRASCTRSRCRTGWLVWRV